MRRILSAILSFIFCFTLGASMFTAEDSLTQKEAIEMFKNGMYIGDWVPSTLSEQTVKEMAECGIQYTFLWAFNYDDPNKVQELEWCSKYGIKVFLKDNRIYGTAMKDMTEDEIYQIIEPSIGNPNILGYCIYDEPSEDVYEDLKICLDKYNAVAEGMIGTVNLYPYRYGSYIEKVFTYLDMDYVSVDIYPLVGSATEDVYYKNLKAIGDAARKYDADFWLFIQSMSWNDRRIPDLEDLRFQAYSAIAYGATKLMHFCYSNPHFPDGYSAVDVNGEKSDLYPVLQQFNTEMQHLAPILSQYKDLGAFYVTEWMSAEVPVYLRQVKDLSQYEDFRTIREISADQPLMVGAFEHPQDGLDKAFVIVNASDCYQQLEADVSFTLRYSDGPVTVTMDGRTFTLEADADGVYRLHLGSGGGAFVQVQERPRTEEEIALDSYFADCNAVKNAFLDLENTIVYDSDSYQSLKDAVTSYTQLQEKGEAITVAELLQARSVLLQAQSALRTKMEVATEWSARGHEILQTSDRSLYEASGFENLEKYLERLDGEMTEEPNYNRLSYAAEKVQEAIETLVFIGVRGDMDKSGKVTLADVLGIARAVLDGSLDFDGQHIADVTEDGAVNLADVIAAARKALSQR